jgi:PIN domain nuclease of toxin-antitoxin system
LALSDMSLLEIAMLAGEGRRHIKANLDELFRRLDTNPAFQILPMTTAIVREAAAFLLLRDPADRVIVATARVHRLTLLTSDQRIIDSDLVATAE